MIAAWLGRVAPSLEDVVIGARLVGRLPAFLRRSITPAAARQILAGWLARREPDFLALVRRAVFEDPGSPYRPLVDRAGVQYGDVERLVRDDGLDGALRELFRAGVYLTADELKGRRSVQRGNLSFRVSPERLRNQALTTHVSGQSTGTGGARTPVRIDLGHVWDQVVDLRLFVEARGDAHSVHGVWAVPGGWAASLLLRLSGCGLVPARWFTQIDPAAAGLHPRYRWSARTLVWGSRLAGVPRPFGARPRSRAPPARASADGSCRGRSPPPAHRAAIVTGLADSAINPVRDFAASDLPLPSRVCGRIESLARPRSLGNSHQLGDGSSVARDHDFLLGLQKRFGLGPSLAQVPDTDRLHDA